MNSAAIHHYFLDISVLFLILLSRDFIKQSRWEDTTNRRSLLLQTDSVYTEAATLISLNSMNR